jgi:hypothetical protein
MLFGTLRQNSDGLEWGTFWEIMASTLPLANYNLKKAPGGADGYDAMTAEGLKVQIKANHSSSTIGFRGEADLLLVLKIEKDA